MDNLSYRKFAPFGVLALILAVVFCLVFDTGCFRKKEQQPNRSGVRDSGGTSEQVFNQSINSFYHLENHFGPDALTQILGRLNRWLAGQSQVSTWQESPFFVEQEKAILALSDNFEQFAAAIERISGGNQNSETPDKVPPALTPGDVQQAVDLGKTLLEQLAAFRSELGIRAFLDYEQRVREVTDALTPVANTAKTRNLSEAEIRGFFQGQFQQIGGNTLQIVGYFRDQSEILKHFAETFRGSTLDFRRLDGDYLKQAFWCKSISQWAGGSRQDEIERAKNLFDWTVRNIMLQSSGRNAQNEIVLAPPQLPWESLLFGTGTVSDWAWVFVELLRQQRIDACLLVADMQDALGQVAPSPWGVGVLVDGKMYVFLVRYGLPLVEESEIRLEPGKGLLFDHVVTYDQLLEKPEILAAILGDDYTVDQVKDLLQKQTKLMIPTDPIANSQRMLILEKALTGNHKAVLFANYEETKKRFEQALPGQTISRWQYPFEANFQATQMRGLSDMRMELFKLAVDANHPYPLWKGRILYLTGRRIGQDAATSELQQACVSDQVLSGLRDRQTVAMFEPVKQMYAKIQEVELALQSASDADKVVLQERLAKMRQDFEQMEAGLVENIQGLQVQAIMFSIAVGSANYWLGQAALEEALETNNVSDRKDSLKAASDYVTKRIINNPKAQQWQHGAQYHLARVNEAQGNYAEAVKYYSTPTQEPDRIGRLYRAKQLQRLAPETAVLETVLCWK